jgi:hypothetical protein
LSFFYNAKSLCKPLIFVILAATAATLTAASYLYPLYLDPKASSNGFVIFEKNKATTIPQVTTAAASNKWEQVRKGSHTA